VLKLGKVFDLLSERESRVNVRLDEAVKEMTHKFDGNKGFRFCRVQINVKVA